MLLSARTRENGGKLEHRRLCLIIKKQFTVWVMESRIPRVVVEILKNFPDMVLEYCSRCPCLGRGL